MFKNFAQLAFTEAVKSMQEKQGSRRNYERMEKNNVVEGLTQNEISFICERDSFYLATIGTNGFPYIQHRGGPKGFLKVLDEKRLGFIDFKGNKQYISVGNLATERNVSLIMVDYPAQARLKIYAKARIIEIGEDSDLLKILDLPQYGFRAERMMEFSVEAYDWNCPQHITPRYTVEEMHSICESQLEHIRMLELENKELKAKLKI